jgi:hypothetical protein
MANFNTQPISQLTLATALNSNDVIPIVDVTDNTQSPSGTTKKCPISVLSSFANMPKGQGNIALTGTISVTNGSPNITGLGTSFGAQLAIGEGPAAIKINGILYTVANVASNVAATLTTNYIGTTASGLTAYVDAPFYTAITSNNVTVAEIANDGTLLVQGSLGSSQKVLAPAAYFSASLSSPSITDNGSEVFVTNPTSFSGAMLLTNTLTGAYHPVRSADFSIGSGVAMLTTDANGIVVSTNTVTGGFIALYSSTGNVPLGFTTKVVMGNTGNIAFIAEGSDNIGSVGGITSLTTEYSTGTLTLISNGNWLLEII